MRLRHRDELGDYLNEAGLTGTGVVVGAADGEFARTVLGRWHGRELAVLEAGNPDAVGRFADGSLDFAYLGVDHADAAGLAAWYSKLRPGGLLAGQGYLDGLRCGVPFGVKRAVDEFAAGLG